MDWNERIVAAIERLAEAESRARKPPAREYMSMAYEHETPIEPPGEDWEAVGIEVFEVGVVIVWARR